MEPTDLVVLTPPGSADPSVAIAAARGGARGMLDLEFAPDPSRAAAALDRLRRFAPDGFGAQLGPDGGRFLSDLLDRDGSRPAWVILSGGDHPELAGWVSRFRDQAVEVLVEAVTLAEAVRGAELGADGIVLKGHEAGGRVGPDTSFVLIQKWRQHADRAGVRVPFWVRGGVGPHTAAACLVAGARGVVLDAQVLLARESPVSDDLRRKLAGCDGGETAVLGERLGEAYRVYSRPDSPAVRELADEEERLLSADLPAGDRLAAWREAVRRRAADDPSAGVWPVGQDVASAAGLAAKAVTVAGICRAVAGRAAELAAAARRLRPLAEGAPLAESHGTKYPILQGPMTRVSDTAAFAAAVAAGGALPFLALALSRRAEADKLLAETKARLGDRPWGVGILGFVPPEIRQEQLDAVRAIKPRFAIIAGGRPDQARELEQHGTATYLHVPSPALLRMFLKDGARRFIFEGRECGGHVGPRTSFALWEAMTAVLAEHATTTRADDVHAVFAGGIHDALSAAMVSALAAGLAEKGMKVGVLLGTAYLFTQEAVESGAITPRFQKEALGCGQTVLLETGPGHAIRCAPTPYAEAFEAEKRRLRAEGKSPLEVGLALERMNLGRLRVASKGVDRAAGGNGTGLAPVPEDEQHRRGMYMIGQVAGLRSAVTTVAELHADVCAGLPDAAQGNGHTAHRTQYSVLPAEPAAPPPCDVAIVGLSCFYPKADGLWRYWENILDKVNAVIEIPPSHWDWRPYYDPDPRARDRMISKWGGFMDDVVFEPLRYGITPKSIPCIEPLQLLLLEAVRQALDDAGYANRPFDRERAAAILGVGGGGMPLSVAYGFRACMPLLDSIPGVPVKSQQIVELGEGILPEWTEDSFPGILLNVAAGRVANRFDLGGPNMAIDAACGSSLAALYAGVRELSDGTSDLAVVMGADAVQTPYAYVAFSKTHALSPKGRCRPFDAAADGIVLAEGIGVAILKRLRDAERDGDRIYGVVKGVGASSDGRDKGLTAPRAEGQLRALHRAYAQARLSPARVGLVEAHGTGTVVGDQTEARALGQVFRDAGAAPRSCALGSVKSMIGHSKCAAGLAGLIKAAFALHHKVLPPTLVEAPNPKANLDGGPLYLNTEPRPWVHGADHPRTAGVSAFGFGGTNFHAVLEEYTGDFLDRPEAGLRTWPAELFVWRRPDVPALLAAVRHCRDALAAGAKPTLADLAASVWQSSRAAAGQPTLAVVATSLGDLKDKLGAALDAIPKAGGSHADPRGIYFGGSPHGPGKVAFLFPGQGSQYPDMLAQTAIAFPEVREVLDRAERALAGELDRPLGRYIYPPSPFSPEQEQANRDNLRQTEIAQPAVGAASLGLFRLLTALGIEPDFLAGHSYGEYVALAAAGALDDEDLIRLSHRRGKIIRDAASAPGGMAAADAPPDAVERLLKDVRGAWVANQNSPQQTVIAGTEAGLSAAIGKLQAAGVRAQRIPVACAFHSPLVAAAKEPLAEAITAARLSEPRKPVFSNTTAVPHPADPDAIARQLAEHLVRPVQFQAEVEAMYEAGARVFVEVGPQAVLTGLTQQVLAGRPHLAVASDMKARPGLVQLAHLLGQLLARGVPARLDRLFRGRGLAPFDLAKLGPDTGKPNHPPTAWVVNGVRSRPINSPEPRLLGQPRADDRPAAAPTAAPTRPAATPLPARNGPAPSPQPATPRPTMNHSAPLTTPTTPHPHPAPSANGAAHPAPDGAAQVMMRFQDVMARFLDTQRSVMLGYLGAGGGPIPVPPANGPATALPPAGGNGAVMPPAVAARAGSAVERPAPTSVTIPAAPEVVAGGAVNGKHSAAASPEAESKTPDTGPLDRDALLARLLDLVSERTGYPKESLSIDLDLEADLGIDSIKRVEILGTLADSLGTAAGGGQPNLEMEKLSVIKTLRGIADYVASALSSPSAPQPSANGPPATPSADAPHPGAREGDVQRLVVTLIDAPLPERPRFAPPAGTILLTDDGRGVARELAVRLAELDVNTALVRTADGRPAPDGVYAADLTDPAAVTGLVETIRTECGPVAGLIHLLPLAAPPDGESPGDRARRVVKSLYLLARALEADVREAGKTGGAVLLAVTAMGGRIGFGGDLPDDFSPGHGGVAGFAKCLGYEWPEVTVRVVDVDGTASAPELAEQLLAELGDPDGPFEVGRAGTERVTWQCDPGPLDRDAGPAVELEPGETVLITGGARGITAKIAEELARRFRPRLVLVGSSPEPGDEPADTAGLTAPAELKAALAQRLQAEGKPSAPAAVEAAYRRLLKDREMRANLAALRAAGGTVEYHAIDVRDRDALGGLIDELNRQGGIAAVIHGAGVIEDKLLRDKTPESFDRVFGTKVDSALTLAGRLDPERVKFFALFASITSRYGNRGQSDYAAANEVLSKLACDLDRRWPGRVVSIAWGPWAGVGMVADLEKHLVARGLKLIEPAAGAAYAADELTYGRKGTPEVVFAGGSERAARPGRPAKSAEPVASGAE
jgi:acyl transferase domain-containing protein/NAD(P)H-dependent flavin oxidoreductase YrpB (nitropropane dioxygenase family)/acyl carrier protein